MTPFIVYALPRSRTAWLSRFLSFGTWTCYHEQCVYWRDATDVWRFFQRPMIGTAETGASPGWQIIRALAPGIRVAVIRRPVEDVVQASLRIDVSSLGVAPDERLLRRNFVYMDRCLARIGETEGALTVDFAELETEDACRRVFEHCLQRPLPGEWWRFWRDQEVQVDILAHLRYYVAHRAEIDGLKRNLRAALRYLARERKAK